ncbi:hypothetical protein H5410_031736 [Solanum commersonii]|uniref:Gag-pol polyprotein n=1 Tax=Solanum commersonii TaxID=4109 RepID=A0A9J5YN92_SOLCO|nr:hypothetical protein H5410_031736 [Solanum commersonii]
MKVEEGEGEPKEIEDDIMVDPAEFFTMIGQGLEIDNEGAILPHVSVHAMNGSHDFRTMRVTVSVKGKVVHVLIDTGSAHNFLNLNTSKKLGCVMTAISHFSISVADGKKIQSNYVCKKLAWKMQGVSFDSDILVLPIGGCNMVLGIRWQITLGNIMWNFRRLKMEFTIMGRKLSLREIQPTAVKMVHQDNMDKLLAKLTELCMILFGVYKEKENGSMLSIETVPDSDVEGVNDLECILEEYSGLFEVPKDLPPFRLYDYKIILQDGTSPINIRPYRYPIVQKDEIEKMIEDMLHSGVIRHIRFLPNLSIRITQRVSEHANVTKDGLRKPPPSMSRENGIETVIGPELVVGEIIDGGGEVFSGVEDLTTVRGDDNTCVNLFKGNKLVEKEIGLKFISP